MPILYGDESKMHYAIQTLLKRAGGRSVFREGEKQFEWIFDYPSKRMIEDAIRTGKFESPWNMGSEYSVVVSDGTVFKGVLFHGNGDELAFDVESRNVVMTVLLDEIWRAEPVE